MMIFCTQALAEHEMEIPETINTQTLIKDLAKEIRLVEVIFLFYSIFVFENIIHIPFFMFSNKLTFFIRIYFSRTLVAQDLSFLVLHSPKPRWAPPRTPDAPLEKRKGPSLRRCWEGLGPQEPKRKVRKGSSRRKQENSSSLRSMPNKPWRNFTLANPSTRTRCALFLLFVVALMLRFLKVFLWFLISFCHSWSCHWRSSKGRWIKANLNLSWQMAKSKGER